MKVYRMFMGFLTCAACVVLFRHMTLFDDGRSMIRSTFLLEKNRYSNRSSGSPLGEEDTLPARTYSRQLVGSRNVNTVDVCQRRTNVAFLKVHKAGSTTIMNVLLRFAIRYKLNIVLPKTENGSGFNYLGYGKTVNTATIVPIPHNETYNILCNHVVYNHQAFHELMPPDTLYVGIVREPMSHFLSAAIYYGFLNSITKHVSFGLTNHTLPIDAFHEYFTHQVKYKSLSTYYVRNKMSFDFGLPVSHFDNKSFIENFLRGLAIDFKLVMIMEYLAESTVLLKRYLCWGLDDVLYVPLNINTNKPRAFNLYWFDQSTLKQWNYADFRIYEYFRQRFLKQVEAEGPSFPEEVKHFKKLQLQMLQYCSSGSRENTTLIISASKWNEAFHVNADNCSLLTMDELTMLTRLIQLAKYKYREWAESAKTRSDSI